MLLRIPLVNVVTGAVMLLMSYHLLPFLQMFVGDRTQVPRAVKHGETQGKS